MANTKIPSELIDGTLGVAGISSSADATAITINSSEQVGIGTTSPNARLVVSDSGDSPVRFISSGQATNYFELANTGGSAMVFSNNNDLVFGTSNSPTERMRINSSGNTAIGTDSPACKLHLQNQDSSDTTVLRLENKPSTAATNAVAMEFWGNEGTANNGVYNIAKIYGHFDGSNYSDCRLSFGTAVGAGSFDDALTVKYGKVGVGLSSPTAKFHTEGSFTGNIGYFNQTGSGGGNHGVYIDCASTGGWTFLARNGGSARFGITGTEARIFNGVTFQSGTSISDKGGHIRTWAGSGYIGLTGDLTGYSAGTYSTLKANGPYIYFDINGSYSAYMSDNGSLNANSDRRLKENIETLSSGQLNKVCNLRGVNFDWIDKDTGTQVGLIAQEVQEEYPELVGSGVEDGTLAVNYAGLVSPLIEAIKELKTKLESAEARITELEG